MDTYFNTAIHNKLSQSTYNTFSVIDPNDPDRIKYAAILKDIFQKLKQKEGEEKEKEEEKEEGEKK